MQIRLCLGCFLFFCNVKGPYYIYIMHLALFMLSVVCISVVGRCQLDITQHVHCVAACLPHIVSVLFLVFILFSLFKCIKGSE